MEPAKFDPILVQEYLNGVANEEYLMIKLMAQVIAILIVGIMLWRVSAIFAKRNHSRRESMFSESRFQQWKK